MHNDGFFLHNLRIKECTILNYKTHKKKIKLHNFFKITQNIFCFLTGFFHNEKGKLHNEKGKLQNKKGKLHNKKM